MELVFAAGVRAAASDVGRTGCTVEPVVATGALAAASGVPLVGLLAVDALVVRLLAVDGVLDQDLVLGAADAALCFGAAFQYQHTDWYLGFFHREVRLTVQEMPRYAYELFEALSLAVLVLELVLDAALHFGLAQIPPVDMVVASSLPQ